MTEIIGGATNTWYPIIVTPTFPAGVPIYPPMEVIALLVYQSNDEVAAKNIEARVIWDSITANSDASGAGLASGSNLHPIVYFDEPDTINTVIVNGSNIGNLFAFCNGQFLSVHDSFQFHMRSTSAMGTNQVMKGAVVYGLWKP